MRGVPHQARWGGLFRQAVQRAEQGLICKAMCPTPSGVSSRGLGATKPSVGASDNGPGVRLRPPCAHGRAMYRENSGLEIANESSQRNVSNFEWVEAGRPRAERVHGEAGISGRNTVAATGESLVHRDHTGVREIRKP